MIERIWSGGSLLYLALLPLSWLYGLFSWLIRLSYRCGLRKSWRAPVPVVVVGNLTAGGNGKTPMVIWLVEHLQQRGYRVGVVSRGYGGKSAVYPLVLNQNTSTREAGDEPVLIYQRTGAPVAIAPKRAEAVQALLQQQPLDAIVTDDGLQHYALQRDFELVVIDGVRRFGNGWWLPAGPMRERAARLGSVNARVANGGVAQAGEIAMRLQAREAVILLSGERRPVAELPRVVAMAGIGHPPRFFATLEKLNVEVVQEVAFADHQEYQQAMLELLADDNARYTWLFDVFFLLMLCGKKIENPQVMRVLSTLKPAQFKDVFPHMQVLLQENNEAKLLTSAAKLTSLTQGWINIFRYRELRFKNQFSEEIKQLSTASLACTMLSYDMLKVTMKFGDYSFFLGSFDDDSFLGKMGGAVGGSAFALGRKPCLSDVYDLRKKAREFLSANSSALIKANGITSRWVGPTFEYDNQISYSDYEIDNSAENEDWYDQISKYQAQIDDSLTAFSNACSDAAEQLELFAGGEFDRSVIRIKEQKHIEWLRQKEQEKLDKQSVTVMKGGKEHCFRIEWQDIENPPCDPENIRHIKTDGQIWLIVDNDECFYRSEDRLSWQTVNPDPVEKIRNINKIIIVEGIWVIFSNSDSGFYYSTDALTWQQSQFPDVPNTWDFRVTEDLFHFNDLWLWRFTERKEYQYKEEGFFFDSTKTSTYDKPVVFCTNSLNAKWRRYEDTPSFSEGIEIQRLFSLPGINCLLSFSKYDWHYLSVKKRPDTESIIEYHVPGKSWRNCTWNGEKEFYNDIVVTRMNDSLMCFYSRYLLTSDKGYEWKRHDSELHVADCFHLSEISLFPSSYNRQMIYLSHDGVDFKELMMDEGDWQYLAANEQGLLSVYSPNSHETFLRFGTYIWLS